MTDQLALPMERKTCTKCNRTLPIAEFHRHRMKRDGRHSHCRDCKGATSTACIRRKLAALPEYRERQRENARASRDPAKRSARFAVWYAIRRGRMPHFSALACVDCGDQATEYDHHMGYAYEHRLSVEPVCRRCHKLRGRNRGEWRNCGVQSRPDLAAAFETRKLRAA